MRALEGHAVAAPEQGRSPRRRERRIPVRLRVRTTTVDAVRDMSTRARCYQFSEDDAVCELSRRGARLRCARRPAVGTRLLLGVAVPGEPRPVELVACVRWTNAEFVPGGARAVTAVGVEIVGATDVELRRPSRLELDPANTITSLASLPHLG
jgi:hypothetical protein